MDVSEIQRALGAIVLESAYLERVLRSTFSALVGSKYAALVAARLTASALIDDCQHIAEVHSGIAEPQRAALLMTLRSCIAANRARNRIIHETWAVRPGNVLVTVQSERNSHDVAVRARALPELHRIADQIADAANDLAAAIVAALGADCLGIGDQLCHELGRDIYVEAEDDDNVR
jgi:uncharacterized protein YutE (UPF0331/DUF86 family)